MKVNITDWKKDGKQKIDVRIDQWDTYSFNSTLAHIIVPMLKKFKKDKEKVGGTPMAAFSDEYSNLVSSSEYYAEPKSGPLHKKVRVMEKEANKKWNGIIDEMIWTFSQYNTDWESKYYTGKIDMIFIPLDKDSNEIAKNDKNLTPAQKKLVHVYRVDKGPKDTNKFDREDYDKHYQRIQNGLALFAKWYDNLWW